MAADLGGQLIKLLQSSNKNVVLKLALVNSLDKQAAEVLVKLQQQFYESNASFVICGLTPQVENFLDNESLLELMNVTPTESEAWDIIQMEEIERELLGDENNEQD
jgi:anti-anti-sigma regulatory factor